ncbi:MAG: PKD domain-containing protein, partial [Phycisphaerae bacterium]
LRVSDGTNTSVDTVTVHINADNDAPSANAGIDQTVVENAVVQLSGGGSDVEGQNLSYQWVQTAGPSVTLSNATSANPTFTAPERLSNTDVAFELRVSDGTNTSVDTVTVHINADNDAPSANAGADVDARSGAAVTLRAVTSDIDSATQQIEWFQVAGPTVTLSDAHAATPMFTAPALAEASELRFELRVSDGTTTSIDTVTVRVAAEPIAPPVDAPVSPSEPAEQLVAAAPIVEPPMPSVEPTVAVTNPPAEQADAVPSNAPAVVETVASSPAQQPSNAASDWDGSEDLQVLDANDGYEADLDGDVVVAAEHIEAVEPALVSMDELFAPTSEIQLTIERAPAGEIELNPNGARFDQVFRHTDGATGNANESQSNFVATRALNDADGAAQPRPRWAEQSPQSFEASGAGVDTGLDEEYVAVGAEEAAPAAERSAGMFAQLWGLVRGLAGTRGDDADSRNRRR